MLEVSVGLCQSYIRVCVFMYMYVYVDVYMYIFILYTSDCMCTHINKGKGTTDFGHAWYFNQLRVNIATI